jgi:hypothetical protein
MGVNNKHVVQLEQKHPYLYRKVLRVLRGQRHIVNHPLKKIHLLLIWVRRLLPGTRHPGQISYRRF